MILTLDTENTIFNKGNPFDVRNKNVCISWIEDNGTTESGIVFAEDRGQFESRYKRETLVVGFNLKYDLHWLKKLYNYVPERVWDCQLCEFFLGRQTFPYPDLDTVAKKYTGEGKSRAVEEYWDRGVNTDQIPREVLVEYAVKDAELTYKIYLQQRTILPTHQQRLFSLQCQDLLVLQEMEWNGLRIDEDLAHKKEQELEIKITELQSKLNLYHNIPGFNWASNDHLSSLLYGGQIDLVVKEPNGLFKTGERAGQPKFKNVIRTYHCPRMYKPLRGTELQKEGYWSVEETTLRKLTGNKDLLDGILEIKGYEKLISTYLKGFPKKRRDSFWNTGEIHTTLNQCVAATGRLTSTKPNCQNLPLEEIGDIFPSRYGNE